MNNRNKRAAEVIRPEDTCRCQPWKGIFTSIPKSRKPVQRNDNYSTSSLVRLNEAFGEEFGMLDYGLTSSVSSEKPKEKSHSNRFTLKEVLDPAYPGRTRNGDTGVLPDKRQHNHRVGWEHSAGRADKQTSPRPGPSSSDSDSSEASSEQAARDRFPRYLAQEHSGAGEKLRCYQNTLTPIQEEGKLLKSTKVKRVRRDGVRLHKYLEDGMKLVEQELIELSVQPSDRQHNHPREPSISQPKDLISKRGTAKDCAEEKLKGAAALPSYVEHSISGDLLPVSLKTAEHTFEDHEVLLAQQKVRELRLEPVCTTSSEFVSGPQLGSSQGLSAGRSRDCASEEFDKQVAERQLEELLLPCSQAPKKEPCQMQTETPPQKILVEDGAHCKVENSESPPVSSDVEKQPYLAGSKLKGYIAQPSIFHEAIEECKVTLHHLCTVVARSKMLRALLSKYSKSGVRVATPDDKLFYIEGLLNATVFLDFDQEGFGLDDEDAVFLNPASRQISFIEEFNAPNSASYKLFKARKIELVAKEIDYPTNSWPNVLKTAFSSAMMSVWRAHKLAFAFEPPVTMFQLGNCLQYDETYMEPHTRTEEQLLSDPSFLKIAEFMVTPGFHVQGRLVVKSQVYCIAGSTEALFPGL